LGYYYLSTLDDKILDHRADDEVHPLLKELQCKRQDPRDHLTTLKPHLRSPSSVQHVEDIPESSSSFHTATLSLGETAASLLPELIESADKVGKFLVLDCKGFLANQRQQRQAGLASLQISQICHQHFIELRSGNATQVNFVMFFFSFFFLLLNSKQE
jgi:hypothetical protein